MKRSTKEKIILGYQRRKKGINFSQAIEIKVCNEICDFAIRNVKGEDGQPLYDFDKDYSNISLETWETNDYQL